MQRLADRERGIFPRASVVENAIRRVAIIIMINNFSGTAHYYGCTLHGEIKLVHVHTCRVSCSGEDARLLYREKLCH